MRAYTRSLGRRNPRNLIDAEGSVSAVTESSAARRAVVVQAYGSHYDAGCHDAPMTLTIITSQPCVVCSLPRFSRE